MSFTVRVKSQVSEGQDAQSGTIEYEVEAYDKIDVPIAPEDADDKEVAVQFTLAQLALYWIKSDQNVLLETNAVNAAGGDAINLTAGVPIEWHTLCGHAKHFTQNVTKFFLTKVNPTEGGTATVKIRVGRDATP